MTFAATLASLGSIATAPVGTAPGYMARAWVNFNGTGTVAIRASGNVSSITDNGTGDYTMNFTTAISDVNFAVCFSCQRSTTGLDWGWTSNFSNTTSSTRIVTMGVTGGAGNVVDYGAVSVSVFR